MRFFRFNILLLSLSLSSFLSAKQNISIASEEIEEFTEKKDKGLYWDLFRLIYKNDKISTTIKPYGRSEKLLNKGKIDILIPLYKLDIEDGLRGAKPFDFDRVSALFKKSKFKDWKGIERNLNRSFVWILEYGYEDYLNIKKYKEVRDRKQALSMLGKDRVDIYLDAKDDIEIAIEKHKLDSDEYGITEVLRLGLYPYFVKSEKGKSLKASYDKRIEEIKKDGSLKALFKKYSIDYLHD